MTPDEWNNAQRVRPGEANGDFKKARRKKTATPAPLNSDRLPPNSVEAEQGVLGCILLAPAECLPWCVERLRAGSLAFYDLRHQLIYGSVVEMQNRGEVLDLITLQQRLKDRNQLEDVGGLAYLAGLPDAVPSAANLDYYLQIVQEKFVLRRLVATCTEIVSRAYEYQGEVDALVDEVEVDLMAITESHTVGSEKSMKQVLRRVADVLEEHYSRGRMQLNGLATGPAGNYLDKLLGGIAPTDYGVIAARPGGGKTSWAMNLVEYLAADYLWWEPTGEFHPIEEGETKPRPVMRERKGIPVAVFSIEMTDESLGMRMLFSRAEVDMSQWMQGFRHKNDGAKLAKATSDLAGTGIYIDASPAQTIGQIAAKARRMARQYGIKLFVLDYLQLVEHDGGNGMDRVKELTKISRMIMALKKQLGVPWIVLAQMNRDIEKAERARKPVMSDLKDCGAIEQDADWVMFADKLPLAEADRRPGSTKANPEGDGPSDLEIIAEVAAKQGWGKSMVPYRVDFILAKHRDGPTGVAQMVFWKNLAKFEDWHQFKVRFGVASKMAGEAEPDRRGPGEGDEL